MGDNYHGDIEIELIVESLSKDFLISPNDLHRGRSDWAGLTLRGRAMLSALLTMRSGWKVSRTVIDNLAPELGRKGVSTVLRELREKRFLHTEKVNGPGGRFTWRWRVHLRPNPAAEEVSAGRTMGPLGDHGDGAVVPSGDDGRDQAEHDVSAGRTMGPSATDGQGDVLRSTLVLEDLENTSPLTPVATEPATVPEPKPGEGEESSEENRHRELLNAAHADACSRQPGWSPKATADAMATALDQGRDPRNVAAAIVALARGDHGPTGSPKRLLADGPWWASTQPPAPRPERPRARLCLLHGQPAEGCSGCADAETEARQRRASGETMTGEQARAAIRAATGRALSARIGTKPAHRVSA